MQIKAETNQPAFRQIKLEISIETQEERDALLVALNSKVLSWGDKTVIIADRISSAIKNA